jgi:hypothetical protein
VLFDPPLLGDVHRSAGGDHGGAPVVHDDAAAVPQPAHDAVGSDDAELEAEFGAVGDRLVDGGAHAVAVVRMQPRQPFVHRCARLQRLQPENPVHALVVGDDARAEVEMPRADTGGTERKPEALPGVNDAARIGWGRGLAHQCEKGRRRSQFAARCLLIMHAQCPSRHRERDMRADLCSSSPRSDRPPVLIQIARAARLGVFGTEVQALKVGQIYEVAPAIGLVLVGEGWAQEVAARACADAGPPSSAHDEAYGRAPKS